MEYYSAIKKNAFESVLMKWMKRAYHTERSKSERKTPVQYINTYIWNLAEKAMAPHSSTLAWKIAWTEEPGGLLSMGSQRVRRD